MEDYFNNKEIVDPFNRRILADKVIVGRGVTFGENIDIKVKGVFKIGDFSRIGDNCKIRGNNIIIGKHFYNSSGLTVGGGGCNGEKSDLIIGDRCTMHNSFINIARTVEIGNDVGFSHHVDIITHGFWQSCLEGYPMAFEPVYINDGVIVGYRSIINPGVEIAKNIVIGSGSVVTKSLEKEKSIYAGVPAKFIKPILALKDESKRDLMFTICEKYYRDGRVSKPLFHEHPCFIYLGDFKINFLTFEYWGNENAQTDDFRDYLRRYGIRIYTERPFKSL
jgi:acetyltransferase-like isoleucine patch superfamily enzyme